MGSSSALIESPASWWDSLAENFLPYLTIYAEEWDSLVEEFLRHLAMTCFAVVLALIIADPPGYLHHQKQKGLQRGHRHRQCDAVHPLYGPACHGDPLSGRR